MSRIVVDIGNSRMKWGRVENGRIIDFVSLDYDQPENWHATFERWNRPSELWTISSVSPPRTSQLAAWMQANSLPSDMLTNETVLNAFGRHGFSTRIENRQQIGTDRLLGILAAWSRSIATCPLIVVAVGTAMTVDLVNSGGVHEGGLILPGPSLMAKSLHDYTAQLPLVPLDMNSNQERVGRNTTSAIQSGITQAILGTVERVIGEQAKPPVVMVTGGLARYFHDAILSRPVAKLILDETLILDGIRIASEPS